MGKKLVSKTAKVLSETRKSKEKEAIAIAYEHIPRNPEEQAHGSLYAVLELEDKTGHAEEIAEGIIDALHNEYYLDTSREPLASFEAALAKINEELAERSGEGQINWLGKLNGVLAVLSGNTIHLTQAGKAEAYLYRGEHTMHITEDLAGDSINPLRTFINIASGDLTENDKIVLLTPGVFLKLSKNEIKKYVTESSPKNAVSNISQLLASENGAVSPNAVLIMEMLSPEAFAAEPEPEAPTEAWVKEEKKPLQEVSDHTITGAAKTFDVLGKAAAGASAFITTRALPSLKSGASRVTSAIKNFRKEPGAEKVILESEEKVNHTPAEPSKFEDDGILDTGEKASGYQEIRIKESETKPKRLSLERFDFSFAKNATSSLKDRFKGNKLGGNRNFLWYFIIGVVVLAGLIGFGIYNSNIQKQKTTALNIYNQAESKYNDANTALAAGQRTDAIEDLSTATELANQAKSTPYQKAQATALLAKIASAQDQASGIVKNTAKLVHDFGKENLQSVYYDSNSVYAVASDGAVLAYDTKTGSSQTLIAIANLSAPIKFSTYVSARNIIVAYTTDKNLYELNLTTKKATKATVSGGLADGVGLASYGSNLYLLSPTNNQIYKYVKSSSGYAAKVNYLSASTGADVTGDVAIAIDSSVYVTTAGGTIQKFTSGQKEVYNVKGMPGSFSGLNEIFASSDVKGQYLSGGKVVIQIDAAQNFVAQYQNDVIKTVNSTTVNGATNLIYVLSAGKLYSITIK